MDEGKLLIVYAPHFVAGAIFKHRYCIKTAPIIKWMKGLKYSDVQYKAPENWKFVWYDNMDDERKEKVNLEDLF